MGSEQGLRETGDNFQPVIATRLYLRGTGNVPSFGRRHF